MRRKDGASIVHVHKSVAMQEKAMLEREKGNPAHDYPGNGYPSLRRLEDRIADLAGVRRGTLLMQNSGMAALRDAIDTGHPTKGTVILYGMSGYHQTGRQLRECIAPRGVTVRQVDTASLDLVADAVRTHSPDIILFELLANGPDLPLLDLNGLLSLPYLKDRKPLLIMDRTLLPLSISGEIGLPHTSSNLVNMESATKFYCLNAAVAGFLQSEDSALFTWMNSHRRPWGSTPDMNFVEAAWEAVPRKDVFDARLKAIMRNTMDMARACHSVQGNGSLFSVSHPNLPDHANSDLANSLFPEGASPVFFIQATGAVGQREIADRLFRNKTIQHYCRIRDSFGFDRTSVLYYHRYSAVRVAGGTENGEEAADISDAFRKELTALSRA